MESGGSVLSCSRKGVEGLKEIQRHSAWRCRAWRDVAWHDVAWRDVVWRDAAWRDVVWRDVARRGCIVKKLGREWRMKAVSRLN